jgi:DDE family transposase
MPFSRAFLFVFRKRGRKAQCELACSEDRPSCNPFPGSYAQDVYLRRCYRKKQNRRHAYWALVESYRTARGPRQRVVAYLGEMDEAGRIGVQQAAQPKLEQPNLFNQVEPQWVEVDLKRVRVECARQFGGVWLGYELLQRLGLIQFLAEQLAIGREDIPWATMSMVLVLARWCDPSSELHLAEQGYESMALADLLGVPADKVNHDRLYRTLDRILPHKVALEKHLKQRLGELFQMEYDLLLYDVTSTYFEGEAEKNPQAQRGYSRDRRPDCKQVNIALVVSRQGLPLGYEIFPGNRHDATTVEEIVTAIEKKYGKAGRIWVMDRGMTSEDNVEFLKQGGRRYILGTPKSMLKRFEQELLSQEWKQVHEGLEVRLCPAPAGEEVFILCRSAERQEKERAIHDRFEQRIEEGLNRIQAGCRRRKGSPTQVAQRVGCLLGENSRAAKTFRGNRRSGRGRMGAAAVEKTGELARVGSPQRGLLFAAQQRDRLERRRSLARLHPVDGSRSRVSRSQERFATAAGLAPERETRSGAHFGLLPGIRAMEDPRADVPTCWHGR